MDPTPQAGPVASPPLGGSPPLAPPANNAGPALPTVEKILAKRAAGEKLSKAEAGRLSWLNRKALRPTSQARACPPRGPTALGVDMEAAGQAELPPAPPVDEALCRDSAVELLDTLNQAGHDSLANLAKAAGATDGTAKEFLERGALKPGAKTALVTTAPRWLPKLVRVAGLNPENAPEALAGLTAALWGVGNLSAAASLKRLAKEREALPAPPPPKPEKKP